MILAKKSIKDSFLDSFLLSKTKAFMKPLFRLYVFALLVLVSGCSVYPLHPKIRRDGIKTLLIETREEHEFDFSGEMPIDQADWPIVLREFGRCRLTIGKYFALARLRIEYEDSTTDFINFKSSPDLLIVGYGDSPYVSKRNHPVIERYLRQIDSSSIMDPIPETY